MEQVLAAQAAARPKAPAAQRFRDSHHMVARMFAMGLRSDEVAERTGYSRGRVYTLEGDPSFQQLIAEYRQVVDSSFAEGADEFMALARSNMMKAERQLADKLDDADAEGETLPTRELVSISRDAADRLGYGKRATQVNLNMDFAAQLELAIKRSGKVIDNVVSIRAETGPSVVPTSDAAVPEEPMAQPLLRRRF